MSVVTRDAILQEYNRYLLPLHSFNERVSTPKAFKDRETQVFYANMEKLFIDAAFGKAYCAYLKRYESGEASIIINTMVTCITLVTTVTLAMCGVHTATMVSSVVFALSLFAYCFTTKTFGKTQEVLKLEPFFDAVLNANYKTALKILQKIPSFNPIEIPTLLGTASIYPILDANKILQDYNKLLSNPHRFPTQPVTETLKAALLEKHGHMCLQLAELDCSDQCILDCFRRYLVVITPITSPKEHSNIKTLTPVTVSVQSQKYITKSRMEKLQERINTGFASIA